MSDVSLEGKSEKWLAGYRQGWYTPEDITKSPFTSLEVALHLLTEQEQDDLSGLQDLSPEYAEGHREFLEGLFSAHRESVETYFTLLAKGIQFKLAQNPELVAHKEEMLKGVHTKHAHWIDIEPEELTATDLRQESAAHFDSPQEAYRIYIDDQPETADALFFPEIGRMGIAWGTDATWASVESDREGITLWLQEPEEWIRRN